MHEAPPLESERVVLEPLRPEHADEFAPVLDDAALHRYVGGRPENVGELRARYTRWAAGRSPDGRERWLNWVVRERRTGEAVGTVQATVTAARGPAEQAGSVDGAHSTDGAGSAADAELAWVIAVPHQGRGLAKEAAGLVAAWLRGQGVLLIRAHIHPDHDASMAVARSVGLRATSVVADGERCWESSRCSSVPTS